MKKSKSFSKNLHFISTSFFILFLFALHVKANTFVVGSCAGGGAYSTIQEAVNAASNSDLSNPDIVEICNGTYQKTWQQKVIGVCHLTYKNNCGNRSIGNRCKKTSHTNNNKRSRV